MDAGMSILTLIQYSELIMGQCEDTIMYRKSIDEGYKSLIIRFQINLMH
jgi:hypothetical protein